ncbi:hypothetical protein [Streptomyces hydrogenans]|uniref:hypothetical protein n=1 Tax=Streptomyces hydrogenans TaxID=1873719 RepID=UPI00342C8ED2
MTRIPATRTTPARPADVAAVFPELAALARPAVRLHPRPGEPTAHDSSVGGPLLWPARQPWPTCELWHEGPVNPLVPVAQLYARDVPGLRPPGRNDLLQVLWCPFEHPPEFKPPTQLFWRVAAEVTDVLAAPPEPYEVEYEEYLPRPCLLAPEEVTEYPNLLELDEETRRRVSDRARWEAAGVELPGEYADHPAGFYGDALSVAPGWKVGGWAPWGLTDPVPRFCVGCGAAMVPLLTVPSDEWSANNSGWAPEEDRHLVARRRRGDANPTGVVVSRSNHLQLYACPDQAVTGHPHTDLVQ